MGFRMNKVAAAVTATLGVAMVGVGSAQADEILFPYIVTSSTVTTLVSTINNAGTFIGDKAPTSLHYRYWYKNGDKATNNAATCDEVDRPLPSSANDIVTFDAGARLVSDNLSILFEDVAESTLPAGNNRGYGNTSFALLGGLTQPVRAFLIVDNNDFESAETYFKTADSLAGEAIVLEFTNGAAWGYAAYNASGRYASDGTRYNRYDFSDFVETTGEVIAGELLVNSSENGGLSNGIGWGGAVPVVVAPRFIEGDKTKGDDVITKFFVTPIARSYRSPVDGWISPGGAYRESLTSSYVALANQLRGDLKTRIRLSTYDTNLGAAVMYDRDEGPVSGQVPQDVTCVGAVDVKDLLSEGASLQLGDGGWSNLLVGFDVNNTPGGVLTDEAVIIKLEYNTPGQSKSDLSKVVGTVNNAIWLRKGIKESIGANSSNGFRFQISTVVNSGGSFGADRNVVSSTAD